MQTACGLPAAFVCLQSNRFFFFRFKMVEIKRILFCGTGKLYEIQIAVLNFGGNILSLLIYVNRGCCGAMEAREK